MTKKQTSVLSALYELRSMLRTMEQDVGIEDLSCAELDVLLAAFAVTKMPGDAVTSDRIRHHDLAADIPQATYHRVLKSLLKRGLIDKAPGYKAGRYVVRGEFPAPKTY
ncbi:hypothetical protein MGEO_20290 [Marivita geojedonensis]|uniref:HTH marR-type domain-containing protein n=2 Tax=Marivita geojedonensis TaxID=1123756 RepID=A0A1X4N914_9RHOB|nr:hypothetical protein MGEO_20290 [Marivita geojedonensis]